MASKRRWTVEEDKLLLQGFQLQCAKPTGKASSIDWCEVARRIPGRTNKDCRKRYLNQVVGSLKKGPWSEDEDSLLKSLVEQHGMCWVKIAESMKDRSADQCSKRWHHSLDPKLDRQAWRDDENKLLLRAVLVHGSSWKEIQERHFHTRSANNIKNQYFILARRGRKAEPDQPPCCQHGRPGTPKGADRTPKPIEPIHMDNIGDPETEFQSQESLNQIWDDSISDGLTMNREAAYTAFSNAGSSLSSRSGSILMSPMEGVENPFAMAFADHEAMHPGSMANFQWTDEALDDISSTNAFSTGHINSNLNSDLGHAEGGWDIGDTSGGNSMIGPLSSGVDSGIGSSNGSEASDLRMTIVIDEARKETLMEVMKVLVQSQARVEFRCE